MKFLITLIFFAFVSGLQPIECCLKSAHKEDSTESKWRRFNATELEELLKGVPKSIEYLGTSNDGKVIFNDNTASITWQEARTNCESHSLRLLAIQTEEQLDFVTSAAAPGAYWVAARENRLSANSFVWDKDVSVSPKYYRSWSWHTEEEFPYLLCLTIRNNGQMEAIQCFSRRWYLCEA